MKSPVLRKPVKKKQVFIIGIALPAFSGSVKKQTKEASLIRTICRTSFNSNFLLVSELLPQIEDTFPLDFLQQILFLMIVVLLYQMQRIIILKFCLLLC